MKKYQQITLDETCGACPEQYDAYLGDDKIGYLRLRHGYFRAEYLGTIVYEAHPNGDGCFEYDERGKYLKKAKKAIWKAHKRAASDI